MKDLCDTFKFQISDKFVITNNYKKQKGIVGIVTKETQHWVTIYSSEINESIRKSQDSLQLVKE